jgi:uncharacterized protein YbjT (DUF2867 family)
MRPVSADDVAVELARVAVGPPLFGTTEVAGPQEYRLDELTARLMASQGDVRNVVVDALAPFFGAVPSERSLLPRPDALQGHATLAQWLALR